jgi:hypothetical protein
MAKAYIKISFDEKGGVNFDFELGATVDKKTNKVVLTRHSIFLMIEEAILFLRAFGIQDRRRHVEARKAKRKLKAAEGDAPRQ